LLESVSSKSKSKSKSPAADPLSRSVDLTPRPTITRFVHLSALAALPALLSACGSGRTVTAIPTAPPPATITMVQIQQQIFTPYCASCHCPGGVGPMSLSDAATSYTVLINADPTNSTARHAGLKRVVPGDPSRSYLLNKLTGQMDFGEGDQMPQNADKLSDADITLIRQWIQAGAPSGLPGR
jgi:mono/diheme cytochrome c family protein